MMRLYFLTFEGKSRVSEAVMRKLHESPSTMTIPLVVLAVLSVIGGFVGIPKFIGEFFGIHNVNIFKEFIWRPILVEQHHLISTHQFLGHWPLLILSVIAALLGIGIAYYLYILKPKTVNKITGNQDFAPLYSASNSKWYVDEIYENSFIVLFKELSKLSYYFDSRFVDGMVNYIADFVSYVAGGFSKFQSGLVRLYTAIMAVGAIAVLILILFSFN